MNPTEYVVLEQGEDGWIAVGKTAGASTPKSILEKWATKPGTYKLVAASAWRHDPVTFAEKTGIVAV